MGIIITCVVCWLAWKLFVWWLDSDDNGTKKILNENEVGFAVSFIETTAKFVKENQSILECNQITMWQHGNVGEGFAIEFYGFDRFVRSMIEKKLEDFIGMWEIYEDTKDDVLRIRNTYAFSYKGSWNNFNKAVWDEVKRKHPEWKIEKPYSYKYVLHV